MRTYLRTLAGGLAGVSVGLAVGAACAAGHYSSAGTRFEMLIWAVFAPVFALLAVVGVFGYHLAGVACPIPPGPRRVYRPVRALLRVVAGVQTGLGALVVLAAVLVGGSRLLVPLWRDPGSGLAALFVVLVAFGVTSLGGLLWCAVRLAYPEGWDDEK